MEPFVNPWVFYLIDVLDGLDRISAVAMIASGACVVVFMFGYWGSDLVEDGLKMLKMAKRLAIVCAISTVIWIGVPSETTIYKMVITRYVTPNNIETVLESLEEGSEKALDAGQRFLVDVFDYAFLKIDELRGGDSDAAA